MGPAGNFVKFIQPFPEYFLIYKIYNITKKKNNELSLLKCE